MFSKRLTLTGLTSIALACASLGAASVASATSLERLDFNQIVDRAALCVHGEVTDIAYETVGGTVYTLTTFDVKSAAFGDPGDTVVVRTAGGNAANFAVPAASVTAGTPRFFTGSDAILFLEGGADAYEIVGFSQGVFAISGDGAAANVRLPGAAEGRVSVEDALDIIRTRRN